MNSKNTPINHHFVPQHFLRAWACDENKKKIFRYKLIAAKSALEIKKVAIARTASIDHLYKAKFPDGEYEFESTVMSNDLDQAGYEVFEKVRSADYKNLSQDEKTELAIYLVCLDARHPEVIGEIGEIKKRFHEMCENGEGNSDSMKLSDHITDYFANSSMGEYGLSAIVQNERSGRIQPTFSGWLDRQWKMELVFDEDCLLTSDYPVRKFGDYFKDILYMVAISPRKALIYMTNKNNSIYRELPVELQVKIVNAYTLAKATCAYYSTPDLGDFVSEHIGWCKRITSTKEQHAYIDKILGVGAGVP